MNSSQHVLFLGRLGKNPELRYTPMQEPVCRLNVAVTTEGAEKPCWYIVVVWGKQAELCQVFLEKGKSVFVQGRKVFRERRLPSGDVRKYEEITANKVGFINL
jgi:single-strand DNA-binding protein